MEENHKYNKLINEKSPYLLQHADNPVNWHPWETDSFEKAKSEDKPIFLSIGYSTCHWCHVMAEESFEDRQVAKLINKVFLSIKVDREERPDIDNIYMTVCQMLTGSGGWPLSIFMTSEKKPFYAATYIPKQSRYGRIGFLDLINKINEQWQESRSTILETANKIERILLDNYSDEQEINSDINIESHKKNYIKDDIFKKTFNILKNNFDDNYGGFGGAPKFPMPHQNFFLLNYYKQSREIEALKMVNKNLIALRSGGIYDHLGYGFHRYSTDNKWLLPHFEKMLYDQALLLYTYLLAYQNTDIDLFKQTAEEIINYLKDKLLS
ncbi:MAG: thioredoxin domain-containing protein, partial [bacterium]